MNLDSLTSPQGLIAGVDEAGRGPLAGPVIAAAVILDDKKPIDGLADSKVLSAVRREELSDVIMRQAICWALGRAEVEEIDWLNILRASLLAMQRAVAALSIKPAVVLVDGNQAPEMPYRVETIVRGDAKVMAISAASILAKVSRDAEMRQLDAIYPMYGFSKHKGYPTETHRQALETHGVSPVHRRSFGPVSRVIESAEKNNSY